MYNNSSDNTSSNNSNASQVLESLVKEIVTEQRRKRRWGIFFKLVFLAIILFAIWGLIGKDSIFPSKEKHIAEIDVYGEIAQDGDVNAEDTITALDEAADDKNTQAIILNINSPGGSPVQASDVYNEIRYLKTKHKNLPIYAACQDACASAAYYIASATDKIYANPTSLVGSIGVLMDGFGFVDTMNKVGATRRLYTAGKYKGMLDPFSPVKPDELQFVQNMLDGDHQIFINDVKKGRGNRIKSDDPNIFTGLIFDGGQAKDLGLIDDYGSLLSVSRSVFHNDTIENFTVEHGFFEDLIGNYGEKFAHQVRSELLTPRLG